MEKNILKLGLFVPSFRRNYNKSLPSLWIRCFQMIKYYKALGISVHLNNPFLKYDISIYYRGMTEKSYYFIKFLKKISGRVYWDTVVNYYVEHQSCNNVQSYYAKKISEEVDGVIVSSQEIGKFACKYNNIYYMPDPIDINHFKYFKKNINFTKPIYGWSGQISKSNELSQYRNHFDKIIIISNKKKILNFKYDFFKWKYEIFPYLITLCDIGFFPRDISNIYNLSHSSFKILVYAVEGIPIITNKIPSYLEVSKFYDAICFLEDFENLEDAVNFLSDKSRKNTELKAYFSCEKWASNILNQIQQ